MPRRHPYQRRRADPTITLINVVFLMLMFFLVAGTIAAPPPADLRLVQLAQADPVVPPDVLTMSVAVNKKGYHYPELHPGCTGCAVVRSPFSGRAPRLGFAARRWGLHPLAQTDQLFPDRLPQPIDRAWDCNPSCPPLPRCLRRLESFLV